MKRIIMSAALLLASVHSSPLFAMAARPQDPNAPHPPAWMTLVPWLFMFGVVYFLILRPQSQQRREREQLMNNLKKGDRIVTQGGFIATVVNVGPQVLEVKLNEDVKVKIQRSGVSEVLAAESDAEKEIAVSANPK